MENPTPESNTEATARPSVLLLPAWLFFIDKVERPDGLDDSELDDFAELSLESVSPFPIEQLNWGFLADDASGYILIYAAHKERLRKLGFDKFDDYAWVLPDFATFYGARFPEAKNVLLQGETGTSQIRLAPGSSIPVEVESRGPGESLPTSDEDVPPLSLSLKDCALSEEGIPTFHFEPISASDAAGDWRELKPSEPELWRADVRSPVFKKAERSRRRLTALTARVTGYAALFAFVLIALEAILFGGGFWLGQKTQKIDQQTQEVRRIEDKQSLMNKLEQVSQNELRPIAILEALNASRPKGIYFTSTVTEGQNRITIDGIANTINELNAYTETLRASGTFQLIGDPKSITRSGKTTFTVTLDYEHSSSTEGQNG